MLNHVAIYWDLQNVRLKSQGKSRDQVAIYWDWQNVHFKSQGKFRDKVIALVEFAKKLGSVKVMNVYAHWRKETPLVEDTFDDLDFKCRNVPASKAKKNNADKKLIKDCQEDISSNPHISTVILLSKDGDFVPLVRELKAAGKKVILISDSDKTTNQKLKNMVDEFYTLSKSEAGFSPLNVAA
ncbi:MULTISPECIES: NYN domain-containing protein [Planktothricoides]|uniref:NYN domain-containing protein n=2 Tax=Planktothricoides raciborskii TaxID=132608 RepID=A0AAU8J7L2_9CYAN|nr:MULTISPECIES: NYN domain-containing protein [Planktothricoides]KOR36029.1 hypothetical protein AM228_14885 [Planktothricoides sp. SR001]MBD2545558.1 NYN domain-containing protein [Planktothricoides raciborskii FACHB-1370]MBD2583464.1 NYN domain-containing protein [Planktothricoides raciborskii FACHB-1261]